MDPESYPVVFTVLLWLTLIPSGNSLYEDQIGIFDWNQRFIGNVRFVEQKPLSSTGTYLFGSDRNVIASVFARNGSLAWRQVLEDDGTLSNLMVCDRITVSFSLLPYPLVRAWSVSSGSVLWENTFDWTDNPNCQCGTLSNTLFCSSGHSLVSIGLHSGKVLWSDDTIIPTTIKTIDYIFSEMYNDTHELIVILGSKPFGSELQKLTLLRSITDPKRTSVLENLSIRAHSHLQNNLKNCLTVLSTSTTSHRFLVCIITDPNERMNTLESLRLTGNAATWLSVPVTQISSRIQLLTEANFILISSSGSGFVYELNSTGHPEVKFSVPQAMFASVSSFGGRNYLFVGHHEINRTPENFLLTVYDMHSGKPATEFPPTQQWTIAKHHGAVESIYAHVFRDSDGSLGCWLLVKTEDHAVLMFRENGRLQWLREESLANIAAVELVDLPVSESQARMEEEFGHIHRSLIEMFVRRLRTQTSQLVAYIKGNLLKLSHLISELALSKISPFSSLNRRGSIGESTADNISATLPTYSIPPRLTEGTVKHVPPADSPDVKTFLTRDTFNLHKMIVVATTVGKVFGIESEKGRVVWEHLVPDAALLANGKLALFQMRSTAHFPLPPVATLLLRSKRTNLPVLFSFNPITGDPLQESKDDVLHFPTDIIQAVLMPGHIGEDTEYTRPILLLDRNSQVHVYPAKYGQSWLQEVNPLYMYTIESNSGRLAGYHVQPSNTVQPASASRVWQINLQSSISNHSHAIVAVASRPTAEHIHSVGRVLGDRSVLYKYLNPNLIAVLTSGGSIATQTNSVTLYLIDVITGRIVYSSVHRRCSEPVNLVFSENWIVYTYYNHKSLRHEATVLELFEPTANGEPCAAYSIPGPVQLFLQNIFPTGWLHGLSQSDQPQQQPTATDQTTLGHKALRAGSRAIFSSLYRTTDFDGTCLATGSSSLIPHVLQQSYIFSTAPINGAAAVSLTERGITSKSIIFGLQRGALIEMPKSLFDPRRVIDLTPELAEEGVHPYAPVLPLSDQSVISFNQSIMGIRSIRTAMTGLESTSLVFAYGLDLFFTRIAPSLTYDLLKEDFDYTAIATVTLGMIVASVVTQRLAARRAMFRAWA